VRPTGTLLEWLAQPSEKRGIRFREERRGWAFNSYAELAAGSRAVAARLAEERLTPGSEIAIVVPSGPDFVSAYFGTLLAGHTPCPLVPPTLFSSRAAYVDQVAGLLRVAASRVLCDEELTDVIGEALSAAGSDMTPIPVQSIRPDAFAAVPVAPADVALLQFTSGSSGRPRGVRVTRANLEAMIDALFDWLPWRPDDAGAHWLPLYHDFGLIGGLLAPVTRQRDLWILRPEQFVAAPEQWLECFGTLGAAMAATPPFTFSYALSKLAPDAIRRMDFKGWRGAAIGAERIDPGVLNQFARLLSPRGFRVETYMPAYGLAEATLAVTGVAAGEVPRAVRPHWGGLRMGDRVRLRGEAAVGSDEIGAGAGWLVSCGRPCTDVQVEVIDQEGGRLPSGHLGEVRVTGPTVADGYVGDTSAGLTRFTGAGLATADAGFVHDGELYVVGRIGDSIKVRGRSVYAEDLEAKLASVQGVRRGRCCVVPGMDEAGTSVVAIVELHGDEPRRDEVLSLLAGEAGSDTPVRLVTVPAGSIPRTSSGKPRRRFLSERLLEGTLELA
jgi:fatty-acyl-CoA synthase